MTLESSFQQFSAAIENDSSGTLGASLEDVFFGSFVLFAPGAGTQAAEDTVPGSIASTATVAVGGSVNGTIDTAGDEDWYRVTLEAGKTYTFSTLFSVDIYDTILQLRDASGNLLATNDDANSSNGYTLSEITFTAASSGTYFLDVAGFSSEIGGFTLSVTRPSNDSIAGSTATTGTLAIGATATGVTDQTGDHDWYRVTLTAGQTYLFTTQATGGANDTDTALYLRDAAGNLLAFNDDNSTDSYSRLRYTPTATGTYYIDVGTWTEADTGDYKVKAETTDPLTVWTYDQIAFQLTNTYWGGVQQRFNVQSGGTLTVNITALTADGQNLAREALRLWSDVSGINFSEVASGGQIRFDDNAAGAFTTTSTNGGAFVTQADVNVSVQWLQTNGTGLRSYSFQTYVHEIGHALGLGHAGPYNVNANYLQDAAYLNDAWATTVMSYFDQPENPYFNGQGFSFAYAATPMIADVIGINALYGAVNNLRTGNTTYGVGNTSGREIYNFVLGTNLVATTIVDHGGTDTLDYSTSNSQQRIDLNPEAFSNIGGGIGNLTIARGTFIENAKGGNGNDTLIGNAVANQLTGGPGNDYLDGNSNIDTAIASGNRASYTLTQTSTGVWSVVGPDGTDTLVDMEYIQFADQLLRLIPGTGTAVDFNAAPSTWMGSIRDFDGNNLGGVSGWRLIGSADVNGDGDSDRILVNPLIGRFAEVATGPGGLVYFSDHGWAGETRVVGIYIDPEVVADPSKAGGPFDSQRRFQNDLLIDNIAGVLGGADYDRDGLQEVYFRLTDGTAYLHSYMHADGNIRYANYQSQSQVIDFLTANGWAPSTWAGWFPGSAEAPRYDKAAAAFDFVPVDAVGQGDGWHPELHQVALV